MFANLVINSYVGNSKDISIIVAYVTANYREKANLKREKTNRRYMTGTKDFHDKFSKIIAAYGSNVTWLW